jgi:ATP-dependent DNA helicase Rep
MVEDLGLRDWVRQSVLSAEAGARKVDAVDAVLRSVEAHERLDPKATLRTFLKRLALDSRDEEPEDADGVTLMTIHAVKELEFPVVFIIGF